MQQKVKKSGKLVKQELKEREEVELEINIVKSWIQETREYLLNPTMEIDAQLEELQVYQTCNVLVPLVKHLWCFLFMSTKSD